ncbi:MAG: hypothetical protein HY918_00535 [Candidatus Doudnabacteria bacterium]|nr:hypothetical protein [Candidatus Doudnabacteria bacterium]
MIGTESRGRIQEPEVQKPELREYLSTLDALSQRAASLEAQYKSVAEKIRAKAANIKKEKVEPINELFDKMVESENAKKQELRLELIKQKKLFEEPETRHKEIAVQRQEFMDWALGHIKESEIMTYLPNSVITEVGMIKEAINSPDVFGGLKLTKEDLESDCKRYSSQLDDYEKLMSLLSSEEF